MEALEDRCVPATVWIDAVVPAQEGVSAGYFRLCRDSGGDWLTVRYEVTSTQATAIHGSDYAPLPGIYGLTGWVSFAPGQQTADIPVNPTGQYDDTYAEGDEPVTITLQAACGCGGGGYAIGSPGAATLTIADNDVASLVWIDTTQDAHEGASAGFFRLRRDITTAAVTVRYTVSGGSATNGSDFPYLPNTDYYSSYGRVTFAAGQATLDLVVDPTGMYDDGMQEGNETVSLSLRPRGWCCCGYGSYTPQAPSAATLTIIDNDHPPIINNPVTTYQSLHDSIIAASAPGLLLGASDPDGDPLTLVVTSGVSKGCLTVYPDGSFRYEGNPAYAPYGVAEFTDQFTYKVIDPSGASSNEVTVTLVINQFNVPFVSGGNSDGTPADTNLVQQLAGKGSRYWVVLFVDQPGAGSNRVWAGPAWSPVVGHAFVGIVDTQTNTSMIRGFYPDGAAGLESTLDGVIRNDAQHGYDVARAYPITVTTYTAVQQRFVNDSAAPPQYDVQDSNCSTWASNVLKETAGIELSVTLVNIPGGGSADTDVAPGPLGEDIRGHESAGSVLLIGSGGSGSS